MDHFSFAWWLHEWESKTCAQHLVSVMAGLVGSCVYAAVNTPTIMLPVIDREKRTLTLGFFGTIIIGVSSAVVIDIAFPVGVFAAFSAPIVLKLLSKTVFPGIASLFLIWAKAQAGVKDANSSSVPENSVTANSDSSGGDSP